MFRKFSPGFSRAVNRLLRSLPGIRHATGTAADPDAATTMEKLDAALNNMMRRVFLTRTFPPRTIRGHASLESVADRLRRAEHPAPRCDRPQCIASSAFDEAPGRFLACLPLRKRMSISVPLTRTSSHRR